MNAKLRGILAIVSNHYKENIVYWRHFSSAFNETSLKKDSRNLFVVMDDNVYLSRTKNNSSSISLMIVFILFAIAYHDRLPTLLVALLMMSSIVLLATIILPSKECRAICLSEDSITLIAKKLEYKVDFKDIREVRFAKVFNGARLEIRIYSNYEVTAYFTPQASEEESTIPDKMRSYFNSNVARLKIRDDAGCLG
ncbi:MAG: hypothetical protein IPO40_10655 [Fibrobacteres bacterium]|nr:hypothetical protein [Fibrobacterota bacterium]